MKSVQRYKFQVNLCKRSRGIRINIRIKYKSSLFYVFSVSYIESVTRELKTYITGIAVYGKIIKISQTEVKNM